ncbi:MAG: hypothetical protein ACK4VN_03430 [Bacteroidales bacterium]
MVKNRLFLVCLILMAPIALWAQLQTSAEHSLLNSENEIFSSRPTLGMQLGSSFSTGFGGYSVFSQSLSPHMNWQANRNFSLTVGSHFTTANMGGNFPAMGASAGLMPDRLFSTTLYAFGSYQLNPRLTLTGGAWTEQNNFNAMFQPQMNPQAFDMNARGMMMGMDYRITDNLRFGAEINISRGYNPFLPYGYGSQPFHSSPFHRHMR